MEAWERFRWKSRLRNMFDLDAIRKRAQQASEHAADSIRQTMEKSEALTVGAKAEAGGRREPAAGRNTWSDV